MAREVKRRSRWLPSLLGLAALSLVGFATGFAAGGLWDGPGLVLQQLLGGGQELAFGPDTQLQDELASRSPGEQVAESGAQSEAAEPLLPGVAPSQAPLEKKRLAAAAPEGAARAATPAVSARGPRGRLAIQVGAFGESGGAEDLVARLVAAGFPAYVAVAAGDGARWRVRVGPFASREKADAAATKLKQSEKLPTWVLDEDAG
jgi:DedD protein